jgi:hypothetical protein
MWPLIDLSINEFFVNQGLLKAIGSDRELQHSGILVEKKKEPEAPAPIKSQNYYLQSDFI